MKGLRPFLPALLLALFGFVLVALSYSKLPVRMPVHWNLQGEVDGWMLKPWGALVLPLTTLGSVLLMVVLPLLGRGFGGNSPPKVYPILATALAAFMLFVNAAQLLVSMRAHVSMPSILASGTGVLFIVVGNYLGKVPRNRFVGIRLPWTLASDHVWERTHRFAAPVMVVAGLAMFVVGLTQPAPRSLSLVMLILVASLLPPVLYSYAISRKPDRQGQ